MALPIDMQSLPAWLAQQRWFGGKGAAIGAGAGAGAGAVTQVATKGGAIRVSAETVLTFQLDKPVKIVEAK